MASRKQIRAARAALGESQAEFAKRFGVSQPTVHYWETQGPPVRGTAAMMIDRVLGELAASAAAEAAS